MQFWLMLLFISAVNENYNVTDNWDMAVDLIVARIHKFLPFYFLLNMLWK